MMINLTIYYYENYMLGSDAEEKYPLCLLLVLDSKCVLYYAVLKCTLVKSTETECRLLSHPVPVEIRNSWT